MRDSDMPDLSMRDLHMRDLDSLMQDKLEIHCRQQLSAMLDGALAPDQARFLLRRLQHDHELAGCWERWQIYGDLLRGSVPALLPVDFAQRVQTALAGQDREEAIAATGTAPRPRWAGWAGGAALAASVAVAALFVVQRAPIEPSPAGAGTELAASAPAEPTPAPRPAPAPAPSAPEPSALDAAGAVAATALAAADAPRRAAARRERPAARRASVTAAASPAPTEVAPARVAVAADQPAPAPVTESVQPAAPDLLLVGQPLVDRPLVDQPLVTTRPWPRSILPGMSGSSLTVDYGEQAADGSGFDHFEPQLPVEPPPR
jgi:negative regulator of sigma E activity